jgi:hypothetical protein
MGAIKMTDKVFSLKEVKQIPPAMLLRMINKAKAFLKQDEVMQRVCDDHGVDVDIIDYIPTMFSDLDVSAKTDKGVVYLNFKLLCDGDFFKDYGYLTHEYTHFLQQAFGDGPTRSSSDDDYLDNPAEEEAFSNQVEFLANEFGKDEAEEYVDHLLEHHELEGKKREEKKELLMEQVSD